MLTSVTAPSYILASARKTRYSHSTRWLDDRGVIVCRSRGNTSYAANLECDGRGEDSMSERAIRPRSGAQDEAVSRYPQHSNIPRKVRTPGKWWRVTPARREPRESATENRPPSSPVLVIRARVARVRPCVREAASHGEVSRPSRGHCKRARVKRCGKSAPRGW
jgi:hypothetical protein